MEANLLSPIFISDFGELLVLKKKIKIFKFPCAVYVTQRSVYTCH